MALTTLSPNILYPPCLHTICGIPDTISIQKSKGYVVYESIAESMLQEINRYATLLTITAIEGEYSDECINGEGLYFTVTIEYKYPIQVELKL